MSQPAREDEDYFQEEHENAEEEASRQDEDEDNQQDANYQDDDFSYNSQYLRTIMHNIERQAGSDEAEEDYMEAARKADTD